MNPNANSYDDLRTGGNGDWAAELAAEQEWIDTAGQPVDETDEDDYADLVDPIDLLHATTSLCEACVPPDVDAVAVLPTGSYRPTFADRCRAERATLYANQRARNERFEHLRRLLCESPVQAPAPRIAPASPMATLNALVLEALRAETPRAERCTCCHEHPSPVFKHDDERWAEEPVYTYLRMGWALRDCPDCIRNFYADAKAAEVGETVKGQCRAELHHWSTETPDSSTVKTEEEKAAEAEYDLGPVSANDLDEVEADQPRLRAVDALLSSTRTLGEDMADEPVFDKRPVGAITANLETGWVTYTSSQAKARVTLNLTTRRIKVRYSRLDIYGEVLKGFSDEQLLARRDGLVRWCELWLAKRGIAPNVASAITSKPKQAVEHTRKLRDTLKANDIEANVRFIR